MARNGNLIVGCLVLLLLAALIVTGIVFGIKALVNRGGDEPAPEESGDMQEENPAAAEETAVPVIDASLASADAFALGNDAYEAGDYPLAEAYYRHAVDSDVSSALYRNNLGLALLQQEMNGEALEIFRALVEEDPATYGYWVNLLVAAHANGIAASEIFTEESGWDIMPPLAAAAQGDPANYAKVLEAILYNAVYMDMELSEAEMYDKGFGYLGLGINPESLATMAASGEYESALAIVLSAIGEINDKVFGENDPDIEELALYLETKMSQ